MVDLEAAVGAFGPRGDGVEGLSSDQANAAKSNNAGDHM